MTDKIVSRLALLASVCYLFGFMALFTVGRGIPIRPNAWAALGYWAVGTVLLLAGIYRSHG